MLERHADDVKELDFGANIDVKFVQKFPCEKDGFQYFHSDIQEKKELLSREIMRFNVFKITKLKVSERIRCKNGSQIVISISCEQHDIGRCVNIVFSQIH